MASLPSEWTGWIAAETWIASSAAPSAWSDWIAVETWVNPNATPSPWSAWVEATTVAPSVGARRTAGGWVDLSAPYRRASGGQWIPLLGGSPTPQPVETRPFPLVASWEWKFAPYTSETPVQTFNRLATYGYNGWVVYSGSSVGWNGAMASVASQHADNSVNLQISPKSVVANDIRAICNNLPVAWRPGFRWNYYQEPEDNHSTPTQIADYKAKVAQAAAVLREFDWGVHSPKPWLELAEYWASTNAAHTAEFIPDDHDDFGGILWSFFEYGENIGMARLQAKVDVVANFMATYAPGKPWEIMASCYTLEPLHGPYNQTQRNNMATWITESFNRLRAAGCTGWAWYNVGFDTGGGVADGEGRVEQVPEALAALQAIAAANYTVPVRTP